MHELGIAPDRRDGRLLIFAADENQPHKFPAMETHVSSWLIDSLPDAAGRGPEAGAEPAGPRE